MKSPQEVAAIIRRLKELYPDARVPWTMERTMSCCFPCAWRPSAPTPG